MRLLIIFLNVMAGLTLVFSCHSSNSNEKISENAFAFSHVNIIDVQTGEIQQGHVIVDSGKIQRILSIDKVIDPEKGNIIDGRDNFLIPGFAEMHAHIPSLSWDDPQIEQTLFLYLSNGVTTIRGMLGHPYHLELREKAENREILSPRIYTSSPSISGSTVTSLDAAREKVRIYADEGYDFLKIHPGLQLDVFDEVVRTANQVGIPFAGHVSTMVGIRHALESNYVTIDHLDGFLEGLVPDEADINPSENGFFGYNFTHLADTALISELALMSKNHKVWVVPTQSLFDRWFSPTDPEILAREEEMAYMPRQTVNNWVDNKKNLISNPNYDSLTWVRFNAIRYQIIKNLQEKGQGLLLGSDSPQVFNVPGFSIHHELKGLIDAGLTPLEAIRTGTINPGKFLDGSFGEIKEGLDADLILLEDNPLENLENLKNPLGVMFAGQWMDRGVIEKKLKEIIKTNSIIQ